jgi:hypothetical protein
MWTRRSGRGHSFFFHKSNWCGVLLICSHTPLPHCALGSVEFINLKICRLSLSEVLIEEEMCVYVFIKMSVRAYMWASVLYYILKKRTKHQKELATHTTSSTWRLGPLSSLYGRDISSRVLLGVQISDQSVNRVRMLLAYTQEFETDVANPTAICPKISACPSPHHGTPRSSLVSSRCGCIYSGTSLQIDPRW